MRLARFRVRGHTRYGVVEGEQVEEVRGSIFGRWHRTGVRHTLAAVKLLAPVRPRQSFAPGLNFVDHLAHAAQVTSIRSLAPHPEPWHKGVNAVTGPGDPIVIPHDAPTGGVQYEGECVAVIGRRCRRVSPAEAWDCVLGYTCGNDVSERHWQRHDRFYWRAKGADTFAPLGPWIETEADPRDGLDMLVRLNGRLVQRASTRDMRFDFGQVISYISQAVTLEPGDLVWSGTAGDPETMRPGDVVEVEVTGIGVLRNPVVAEGHRRGAPER